MLNRCNRLGRKRSEIPTRVIWVFCEPGHEDGKPRNRTRNRFLDVPQLWFETARCRTRIAGERWQPARHFEPGPLYALLGSLMTTAQAARSALSIRVGTPTPEHSMLLSPGLWCRGITPYTLCSRSLFLSCLFAERVGWRLRTPKPCAPALR